MWPNPQFSHLRKKPWSYNLYNHCPIESLSEYILLDAIPNFKNQKSKLWGN